MIDYIVKKKKQQKNPVWHSCQQFEVHVNCSNGLDLEKRKTLIQSFLRSGSNMSIAVLHLQICLPPTAIPPKTTPCVDGSGGQAEMN